MTDLSILFPLRRPAPASPSGPLRDLATPGRRGSRPAAPAIRRRRYDGALNSRYTEDWVTPTGSSSADILPYLRRLIDRSRALWRDNDYVAGYGRHLKKSVLHSRGGAQGMILQNRAVTASGEPNDAANEAIEAAWADFCLPGNCDVTRTHSMADLIAIAAISMARDGMILVRLVPGFANTHRFAVQLLDVDYLDIEYTGTHGGNRVIGGVEIDAWGAPVSYFLRTEHPGAGQYYAGRGRLYNRERVYAEECFALFVADRAEQYHAAPWFHASILRLRHLGRYEESELIAARVGAAKMGFYTTEEGKSYGGNDILGSDEEEGEEAPELVHEASPGTFEELPAGVDFKEFAPDHPNTALPDFIRHMLRGAGAGVNVSYANFANDSSQSTFASTRQGEMNERDQWLVFQDLVIGVRFLTRIFMAWARIRVLDPSFQVPASKAGYVLRPTWHGKRWQWIDPAKEATATAKKVELRAQTVGDAISESGGDFDETMERWRRELSVMRSVFSAGQAPGLEPPPAPTPEPAQGGTK